VLQFRALSISLALPVTVLKTVKEPKPRYKRLTRTMKNLLLLFLPCFMLSCSKNNAPTPKTNDCNEIVEVIQGGECCYYTAATLTYDANQRVKTVTGQGLNKTEYTYYNDSIAIKATDINGNDISALLYLDHLHRATGSKFFSAAYTYNADGYMISYKQPYGDNGQITGFIQYYLTWQNGDLISVYTDDANASYKNISFQYFNLPNQNLLGYNSPFYSGKILTDRNSFYLLNGPYFGKQSKDLLKNVTFNGIQYNDITYQSDSTGRIIKSSDFFKFTYKCP